MRLRPAFSLLPVIAAMCAAAPSSAQTVPLAQRITHYVSPTSPPPPLAPGQTGAHQGVGSFKVQNLLDPKTIQGNWLFVQRAVLWPHVSIGEHFHEGTEEMFVILDGDAQFTVDGRTSVIKGPAAVPVRLTHGHAVYNPTDRPMQWMNFSVSAKNGGGTFENGDTRAGADVRLDPVPQFVFMKLDRALLHPVEHMDGGVGTVMYRRGLTPGSFSTLWAYVDQIVIPPGASLGAAKQDDISEVYSVLAGAGAVTINGETAPIKAGDVVPVDFGQTRAIVQTGAEPLELLINAVARNTAVKAAIVDHYPAPRPAPAN